MFTLTVYPLIQHISGADNLRDRSIRRLNNLNVSASTCRVLNLVKIHQLYGSDPDYKSQPLFSNRLLNQSIILKHRLRDHELDQFDDGRTVATKIVLPIDRQDLRSGGQYMFIGQRGEEAVLAQLLGDFSQDVLRDRKTLEVLGGLPSFDPFLVREHLRRHGLTPAPCYFAISQADTRRMMGFVQNAISDLTQITLDGNRQLREPTNTLAAKLMSNETSGEMEPLRQSMRMDKREFADGLFAWKGLLYYKWVLSEMTGQIPSIAEEIRTLQAAPGAPDDVRRYLVDARRRIIRAIVGNLRTTQEVIGVYDRAYAALTHRGKPLEFRDFLIEAPQLFLSLGETLGVLSHVVSFWRFRFPRGVPANTSSQELVDVLTDFDTGLSSSETSGAAAKDAWDAGPDLVIGVQTRSGRAARAMPKGSRGSAQALALQAAG